jgi:hypothetical protein
MQKKDFLQSSYIEPERFDWFTWTSQEGGTLHKGTELILIDPKASKLHTGWLRG